jgi:hypothetical protein
MTRYKPKATFVVALLAALAACVVPASASALTWGPAGTNRSLDSASVLNTIGAPLNMSWTCSQHLGLKPRAPVSNTADVTAVTFSKCAPTHGTGIMGCTVAETATSLPWTIQGLTTTNVILNVGNINVRVSGPCLYAGEFKMAGSIVRGVWSAPKHSLTYSAAGTLSTPFSTSGVETTAEFEDPEHSLTLF